MPVKSIKKKQKIPEREKIPTVARLICNYRSATVRKYTQNDKATNTRVPRSFTGSPLSTSVRWIPIGTPAVLINLLLTRDVLMAQSSAFHSRESCPLEGWSSQSKFTGLHASLCLVSTQLDETQSGASQQEKMSTLEKFLIFLFVLMTGVCVSLIALYFTSEAVNSADVEGECETCAAH